MAWILTLLTQVWQCCHSFLSLKGSFSSLAVPFGTKKNSLRSSFQWLLSLWFTHLHFIHDCRLFGISKIMTLQWKLQNMYTNRIHYNKRMTYSGPTDIHIILNLLDTNLLWNLLCVHAPLQLLNASDIHCVCCNTT